MSRRFVSTLLALVCATAPALSTAQTRDATETAGPAMIEARVRHAAAVALMAQASTNATLYNAALAEFERAYQLLEGNPRRYLELKNIGDCHLGLGQTDAALDAYRRYLREGGASAENREDIEQRIRQIEDTLGSVEVLTSAPGAEVWVDNRRVGTAPGTVRVPGGGQRVIEVRAPGHAASRQTVRVVSRQSLRLRFALEPIGFRGLRPAYFWVTAGLGGGAAITGAVFGLRALWLAPRSTPGWATRRSPSASWSPPATATTSDRLALVADVFFASAALLAAGATVLAFVTDFHRGREHAARPARGWALLPWSSGAARGASWTVGF
ncbi:MAG: PEGA domain-containing protein [Deltaproteobacteria bacterium]|nr:PEGA domain-containing protein [Deltaproteobacteria bacterium]